MSSTLLYFLFIISIGYGVILANKINNNYINCINTWDWTNNNINSNKNNQLLHDIYLSSSCPSLYTISSCTMTVNINGSNHHSIHSISPSFKSSSNSCILTLEELEGDIKNVSLMAHCCINIDHTSYSFDHSSTTGHIEECYHALNQHQDNDNNHNDHNDIKQINCHTQNQYTDRISITQFYRNTDDNVKYV